MELGYLEVCKRNLVYMKVHFLILFKILSEYKINFYMALLNNLATIFTQIIILNVLYLQFSSFINWEFEAYVFFILITNFMFRLTGAFWFSSGLKWELVSGKLNVYLTKPINIFIQYLFNNIPVQAFVLSFIYFIGLIVFFIYYFDSISFLRLILLIPFLLLAGLLTILFFRFLDSLAFFLKENHFILHSFRSLNLMYMIYPVNMFDNIVKKIGYLFGVVYFGAYSTQFFFLKISFYEFYLLNLLLIALDVVFFLLLVISWKVGLSKYEAFG